MSYFYSDVVVDIRELSEENMRDFVDFCEQYVEEHVDRITEQLIFTREQQPSRMKFVSFIKSNSFVVFNSQVC